VPEDVHATSELVFAGLAVQTIDELRRVVHTRLLVADNHTVTSTRLQCPLQALQSRSGVPYPGTQDSGFCNPSTLPGLWDLTANMALILLYYTVVVYMPNICKHFLLNLQ